MTCVWKHHWLSGFPPTLVAATMILSTVNVRLHDWPSWAWNVSESITCFPGCPQLSRECSFKLFCMVDLEIFVSNHQLCETHQGQGWTRHWSESFNLLSGFPPTLSRTKLEVILWDCPRDSHQKRICVIDCELFVKITANGKKSYRQGWTCDVSESFNMLSGFPPTLVAKRCSSSVSSWTMSSCSLNKKHHRIHFQSLSPAYPSAPTPRGVTVTAKAWMLMMDWRP